MADVKSELVSLGDSALTTEDPAQDIRGRDVFDVDGEKIGHVRDLLVDESQRKVRLMEVGHGGILGIGESKVLIPIDAITRVGGDEVRVDRTREHIASAPRYDPEVVVERDYYSGLYGHYGLTPYWGPGYVYPAYPYLMR